MRLPGGVFISHSLPERVDTEGFDLSVFTRQLADEDYLEEAGVFRLVWGRDYRSENAKAFAEQIGAKVLVVGHDPCGEGFNAPNDFQVIIDCCGETACYAILPTNRELSQAEVLKRIERLQ